MHVRGSRNPIFRVVWAFALMSLATAAMADEGEQRVKRDIERFVRSRIEATEPGASKTTIDVPPLRSFTVDRARD